MSQLWDSINPDVPGIPFLEPPTKPKFTDYFVQSDLTPETTGTSGNETAQEAASQRTRATDYDQLSEKDQRSYGFKFHCYELEVRMYKEQQQYIISLVKWVENTVKPEYTRICCHPEKSIRDWYQSLKTTISMDRTEKALRLNQRYRAAVRPMTRAPKDFDAWVSEWGIIMSEFQQVKPTFYDDAPTWFDDFFAAIRGVRPSWEHNLYGICHEKLEQGTLTPHILMQKIRNQILHEKKVGKGSISHGAFGPTFGNTPKNESQEGAEKKGKKRSRGEGNTEKCIVCERGRPHPLSQCWYAFPDQAKEGWKPREEISRLARRNLEKDSVKEKIKEASSKRVKTDQD